MAKNQTKAPLVIVAALVFTMGMASFLMLGGSDSSKGQAAPQAAAPRERVAAPVAIERTATAVEVPPIGTPDRPRSPALQRKRMTRDVKREQIWSALGRKHELEPAAAGSAAPSERAAARLPALDPEYIRAAITEQLLPVAIECYETALADDPKLAGTLVAEFTIIAVEEVGGVVEEAALRDEGSTLDSEFVRECMRESLMAVTFEPPTDGGRVEVTYPFEFSPDGP